MAVMNQGKLEQIGAPRELYQQPTSPFVAEFLGEVNWLNGAGVRPEAIRISRKDPGEEVHSIPGVVVAATFLGNCVHLQTRLSDGAQCIVEIAQTDSQFQPGDAVHMWWNRSDELPIHTHG
jgi:ABC-type Fe3+/spermidine/putrescine transport system ATPase subunit